MNFKIIRRVLLLTMVFFLLPISCNSKKELIDLTPDASEVSYEMDEEDVSAKDSRTDEERITSLLNYINFSTSKISQNSNIGILENEFNGILNQIEPASLINDELIGQYGKLLYGITNLQLTQNKREILLQEQEKQRKNAVYNCFSNFGSVFAPGSSPLSLAVSLGYAALNAGFNYARTVNEIDSETRRQNFELDQEDLQDINSLRSGLFQTSAHLLKNTGKTTNLIADGEMQSFAKIVAEIESARGNELRDVCKKYIPVLDNMYNTFSDFVPYALVYGICCYENKDYERAIIYFDKVEALSNNIYVLKHNPYLVSAAKYKINIVLKYYENSAIGKKDAFSVVKKYIKYIEQNTLKTTEAQDDLAYYLYSVYLGFDENDKAEEKLQYLLDRKLEADYGNMATVINLNADKNDIFYKLANAMDAYKNGFFFYEVNGIMNIYCKSSLCSIDAVFIDGERENIVNGINVNNGWKAYEIQNAKNKNIKFSKFEDCRAVRVVLTTASNCIIAYNLCNVKKTNISYDRDTIQFVDRDKKDKYVTLAIESVEIQGEKYQYVPNINEKCWSYYE